MGYGKDKNYRKVNDVTEKKTRQELAKVHAVLQRVEWTCSSCIRSASDAAAATPIFLAMASILERQSRTISSFFLSSAREATAAAAGIPADDEPCLGRIGLRVTTGAVMATLQRADHVAATARPSRTPKNCGEGTPDRRAIMH